MGSNSHNSYNTANKFYINLVLRVLFYQKLHNYSKQINFSEIIQKFSKNQSLISMEDNLHEQLFSHGYEVVKSIGKGGFASVFLVKSHKYGVEFAAKVMKTDNASQSRLTMYKNEVELLKKLDHPNIIKIYEYFEIGTNFVIILEYCPGGTLHDEIEKRGFLPPDKFFQIAIPITNAIKFMHQNGIAHHDIKPKNILFDTYGRPKLVDFGIGVIVDDESGCDNFYCSRAYAPPEIHQKKVHNPFAADIWSLGVSFVCILSGSIPFNMESNEQLRMQIVNGLFYIDSTIPSEIRKILIGMLRVNPNMRHTIEYVEKKLNKYVNIFQKCKSCNSLVLPPLSQFQKKKAKRISSLMVIPHPKHPKMNIL